MIDREARMTSYNYQLFWYGNLTDWMERPFLFEEGL